MILFATSILLIFDLIVFVVNLNKVEKVKKENEELKKLISEKEKCINSLNSLNGLLREENKIRKEMSDKLYDILKYHLEGIE